MKKIALHWQILIAIVFAAAAGIAVNIAKGQGIEDPSFLGVPFVSMFGYVGDLLEGCAFGGHGGGEE